LIKVKQGHRCRLKILPGLQGGAGVQIVQGLRNGG